MFFSWNKIGMLSCVVLLFSCADKAIETDFYASQTIEIEPDEAYCSLDSYVELEDGDLGQIKSIYNSNNISLVLRFEKQTDEVSIYYSNGGSSLFSDIVSDTAIDLQTSEELGFYIRYGRYGNEKAWPDVGKLYFNRLADGKLRIRWCNVRVSRFQGNTMRCRGEVTIN